MGVGFQNLDDGKYWRQDELKVVERQWPLDFHFWLYINYYQFSGSLIKHRDIIRVWLMPHCSA